jgi:hypothetical protein
VAVLNKSVTLLCDISCLNGNGDNGILTPTLVYGVFQSFISKPMTCAQERESKSSGKRQVTYYADSLMQIPTCDYQDEKRFASETLKDLLQSQEVIETAVGDADRCPVDQQSQWVAA